MLLPLDLYIDAEWAREISAEDAVELMLRHQDVAFEELLGKCATIAHKNDEPKELKSGRLTLK